MAYDLVLVEALDSSPVTDAYYGRHHVLAWLRKPVSLPSPYPCIAAQLIDGSFYVDEQETEEFILDLWDIVGQYRLTGDMPPWWVGLIERADTHPAYQPMLDHLYDIARRQVAYEQDGPE